MRFEVADDSDSAASESEAIAELVDDSVEASDLRLVGTAGWIFSKNAIELLHNETADAQVKIQEWHRELARRDVFLSENKIQYFHVCVPDKLSIYGDFVDRQATPFLAARQFSPLKALSKLESKLSCLIDPSNYFTRQVDKFPLYWKSDTRWTPWSAYMTCQLLCSQMNVEVNNQLLGYRYDESTQLMNLDEDNWPDNPELIRTYRLKLRSKRRFANKLVKLRETSIAQNDPMLGNSKYGAGAHVVYENHHEKAQKNIVILFGNEHSADSSTLLSGMLAETFSEVHFVWGSGIDYNYVETVQPDVVITQDSELQLLGKPSADLNIDEKAASSIQNLQDSLSAHAMSRRDEKIEVSVPSFFSSEAADTPRSKVLLHSEKYSLDAPVMVQLHEKYANAETNMISNEVILQDVPEAQVFFSGSALWVHGKKDQEVIRENIPATQQRPNRWRRGKRLQGITLAFATSAGAHCYYHWMLEILPKLGILEREGILIDSIDHFLVRKITANWQLETLARFGIDESRIVEVENQHQWQSERLLHIDLNCGINLKMHRFTPQWMKHLFPSDIRDKPRIKLYISRPSGVRRGIANEHEILPLLEEAGFTIMAMEGLSVAEQSALLARADVLMSPHGGALTNMVFCRPGIKVVEMLSRHVFPYYYGLAANCGHQYHAILENPGQDYPRLVNAAIAQSFADTQHETANLSFDVSLDAIKAMLKLV